MERSCFNAAGVIEAVVALLGGRAALRSSGRVGCRHDFFEALDDVLKASCSSSLVDRNEGVASVINLENGNTEAFSTISMTIQAFLTFTAAWRNRADGRLVARFQEAKQRLQRLA